VKQPKAVVVKHVVEILSTSSYSSQLAPGDKGDFIDWVEDDNGRPSRLKVRWVSGSTEDLVIGEHEFNLKWVSSDTELLDSDLAQKIAFASAHPSFYPEVPESQSDAANELAKEIAREKFQKWKSEYGSLESVTEIGSREVDPSLIWTVLDSGYAINGHLNEENRDFAEEQCEALESYDEITGYFIRGEECQYEFFTDWIKIQIGYECGDCLMAQLDGIVCESCGDEEFVAVKLFEDTHEDS
jgi:hypothetical protein